MNKLLLAAWALLTTAGAATAQTENNTKMKPIAMTRADFLQKVADYEKNPDTWHYLGDKPAVIDFYASWCGPCRALAPVLDELAAKYGEEIYVYKIDVDSEQELAAVFGIRSIPTLLFIPTEGNPRMVTGMQPKNVLEQQIREILPAR